MIKVEFHCIGEKHTYVFRWRMPVLPAKNESVEFLGISNPSMARVWINETSENVKLTFEDFIEQEGPDWSVDSRDFHVHDDETFVTLYVTPDH